MVTYKQVQSNTLGRLNEMVKAGQNMDAYLQRVAYPAYQNYQLDRWKTKNAQDGGWKPIDENSPYAKWKRKKFADYPGGGTTLMVATGNLVSSVTGPMAGGSNLFGNRGAKYHGKLIKRNKMTITTRVPYASYADDMRTFTTFTDEFYLNVSKGLGDYLLRGKKP